MHLVDAKRFIKIQVVKLYNEHELNSKQIAHYKNRLVRAFTETALYSHPFEHFVINAPEEIHRISSKIEIFNCNAKNQFLTVFIFLR